MTAPVQFAKLELGTARKAVARELGPKHAFKDVLDQASPDDNQVAPDPKSDLHGLITAQPQNQEATPMIPIRKTRELDSQIAKVLTNATPIKMEELDDDDLAIAVEQPANRNFPRLPELFLPAEAPLSQLERTVMHDLVGNLAGSKKTRTNLAALTPNVPINPPLVPTANQRLEPDTLIAELPVEPTRPTRQVALQPDAPLPMLIATPPARTARGTEPRAIMIPEKIESAPAAKQLQPLLSLVPQTMPMTPLEQAVHDLIIEARDDHDDDYRRIDATTPSMPTISIADVLDGHRAVEAKSEVAGPREIPQQPVDNPNHVHLVIDDGGERVVVTVAVRGDNVNVAMRTSDEGTAAALARNAGSLDHAMRGRGLNLAQLDSNQHDSPRQQAQREREQAQRDRRAIEEFTLDLEVA